MSPSEADSVHCSSASRLAQSNGQILTVSVLMSTYAGESGANLAESLESICAQTVTPGQIVLVVDGPIGVEQEEVLARYAKDPRVAEWTLVRLPTNGGLARAMNAGLERCTGTYIMRADSDDICEPCRLEVQLAYAEAHPETDVLASWCTEFYDDGRPETMKTSSVHHDAVVSALRWRGLIVHPTVLIRKKTLLGVGGYRPDFGYLEDVDLFARLVMQGAQFHVIPKSLLRMRVNLAQRRRRGGWRYCLNQIRYRINCFRIGFLNTKEFLLSTPMHVIFNLIGAPLRDRLYVLVRISSAKS
jgi:glycosyltransferase involved in cell wall biosynthesis